MKKILVTGHTGFIGSHVVDTLLRESLHVCGLTRQSRPRDAGTGTESLHGDLTEPASLDGLTRGIDTIFHIAGYAHAVSGIPGLHYKTTLEGTRHLLAEARRCGVRRFIFISSVKAMPDPGTDCLNESVTGMPEGEYGLSRRRAEELVLDAGRRNGMHVCILRPALVYGPGCKGNLLSMLRWIDRGLFPPVPETGNRRSLVDVRDLVRAILLAARQESANGKICIITDNQDYSTRRIYTAMCAALGKRPSSRSLPVWLLRSLARTGDAWQAVTRHPAPYNSAMCARLLDSACYHSIRAGPTLGFRPRYRLEDALPGMVQAYRRQAAGLRTDSNDFK